MPSRESPQRHRKRWIIVMLAAVAVIVVLVRGSLRIADYISNGTEKRFSTNSLPNP